MVKLFNSVDTGMVTDFVINLPKFCPYCGSKCWGIDEYPYACRCSSCSSYFHCEFTSCSELDGYNTYFCTSHTNLQLLELDDGTLVEVCTGCIEWLYEEGCLNESFDLEGR